MHFIWIELLFLVQKLKITTKGTNLKHCWIQELYVNCVSTLAIFDWTNTFMIIDFFLRLLCDLCVCLCDLSLDVTICYLKAKGRFRFKNPEVGTQFTYNSWIQQCFKFVPLVVIFSFWAENNNSIHIKLRVKCLVSLVRRISQLYIFSEFILRFLHLVVLHKFPLH